MAVWIAFEPSVFDHRKTLRLSIRWRLRQTYVAAHLARLWTWALTSAPTGELLDCESEVIARAADWTGDLLEIADEETFVAALVEVGFLDRRDGLLVLHGWRERHEAWADRREAEQTAEDREAERRRKQRELKARTRARVRGESPDDEAPLSGDVSALCPVLSPDDGRTASGLSTDLSGAVSGQAADVSGAVRDVSPDGPVVGLARPDRTGPDRDRTSPDRTGPGVTPLPPIVMGGAPPAPRTRGEGFPRGWRPRTSSAGAVFASGCPSGCPSNHGGPGGLSELRERWGETSNGGAWLSFARSHGRMVDDGEDVLVDGAGDSLGNSDDESGGEE